MPPRRLPGSTGASPAHVRVLSARFSSTPPSRAPHPLDVMPRRGADRLADLPAVLAGFVRARAAGVSAPCRFSYGNALAACAAAAAAGTHAAVLAFAEQLYCAAWKDGLSGDAYVCSAVVDLFAKGGRLGDALRAFEDGDRTSAVCWNAAISGAVRNCEHTLAVEMFGDMVRGPCRPNLFTYSGALSACAAGVELRVGTAVHGMVLRRDPEYDVFVGTSIVNMYTKCGDMGAAIREFWKMPVRNVVSWTTVIAGFVQEEEPASALLLLREMVRSGVAINKYTATSILLACSQMSMVREASQVHGMIVKTELYLDHVVKEALICTYANVGAIQICEKVFEEVGTVSNRSIWSAFISGVISHSLQRSIELLKRMFQQGLRPNDKCYASFFGSVDSIELGRQLHSCVIKDGFFQGILVGSALSTMYSRCDDLEDSYKVFQEMQEHDEVSWTSMVAGFATHGHSVEAFQLFRNMVLNGFTPDDVSIGAILSACYGPECLPKGKEVHGHVLRVYGETTSINHCLVSMYSKCRDVQTARRIFDAAPCKGQVMLSSMISGYSTNGFSEEAISLFQLMVATGFQIDRFVCSSILSLCADLARPLYGKLLHGYATKIGILSDLSVSSSLVKLYSKSGNLHDSRKFFDEIRVPDLVTWTAIIDGYAQHGSGQDALAMFELMINCGVKPDTVVLVSVLSACGRNGLVEEGFKHFNLMRTVYGVEPLLHHYCCMVDLLGRSGRLAEAKSFIESMPLKPDLMVWSTLLAACRVHDDAILGRFVENKICEENYDSECFATLSNIRANSGDWEAVAKIRKSVKGVKKEPGWSMV
ncbi:pentatricopeptide repeat-containing protein At1g74600, chloroplastic-like [Phragmites australis]|uniref:pentatricopeptide repeat-containing protein At1g74600, chloroplastic-like n=1 Tax=Phragmites australis TaxID=29695 RepID=UPI002D77453C|nr:pentatricopeptide repeat-containing protein At1g74600, chloroplastic-like [Phragmites australis]XP_062198755.1 pentatricopeptide repeat-containing protein At1g74600, chloroplastic-like [Phragmites australis]XP_062198757.1 pentatricopeptide repeat-containing protein At1g74600, chloroplastic-like [Phragmites australis]XP_062198758.1 pentatricopeptide repeat-containing protein At1g74600, chloroplastic-like [Phragmites australis]